MAERIVIVAGRLPPTGAVDAEGAVAALAAGLGGRSALWFGWSGRISGDERAPVSSWSSPAACFAATDLTAGQHEAYSGFARRTLWPALHGLRERIYFQPSDHAAHRAASGLLAARLKPLLRAEDVVWVVDHRLAPLARLLRQAGFRMPLGFVLQTPFPAFEPAAPAPWLAELVADLSAYDLVGFQTHRDERNFLQARQGLRRSGGAVPLPRASATGVFPMAIPTRSAMALAESGEIQALTAKFGDNLGGQKLVVGVDRLDVTKGLVERFLAYERLLEESEDWRGRASLVQITTPPDELTGDAVALRAEQQGIAQRINERFASPGWLPVFDIYAGLPRRQLVALYRFARVGLVMPLRDGMGLAAKEFLAAQDPRDPAALVLSRASGASRLLGEALLADPGDAGQVARALRAALRMPLGERQDRWRRMIVKLLHHNAAEWCDRFLWALVRARPERAPSAAPLARPTRQALRGRAPLEPAEAEIEPVLAARAARARRWAGTPAPMK
jgi:trehalose 6-phosphate synthase